MICQVKVPLLVIWYFQSSWCPSSHALDKNTSMQGAHFKSKECMTTQLCCSQDDLQDLKLAGVEVQVV